MRTIIRDNYDPQLGEYHERIIIDEARKKKWVFDCDGVFTDFTNTEVVNEKGEGTDVAVSQKLFTDETKNLWDAVDNIKVDTYTDEELNQLWEAA